MPRELHCSPSAPWVLRLAVYGLRAAKMNNLSGRPVRAAGHIDHITRKRELL